MSNPILYFSLLGRTNSGKTCLFAALKAPKEKEVKEIDFTFSSQDQFNVAVEKLKKEKYLESGFKYEEMESKLTRYVKDLEIGNKPKPTKLEDKKLYVFSYTKDNTGADLALFDYAGETLNIDTKSIKEDNKSEIKKKEQSVSNDNKSSIKIETGSQEQEKNKKKFASYPYLKDLLKQMDAIFAIIGIPKNDEEDKFIKEIDDLKSAFKRVGFETEEGSIKIKIPIVLMVTKFDRYISNNKLDFNKFDECKKHFEASEYYKELEDLIRLIKNNTDKDKFKVFYTSAFGECSDNDIPVQRDRLKPINLLEPFEFAVEKVAKNKLEECKESEKRNLLSVLFKPSEYFNQAINIMPIFPENSEEKNELERINTFLKSQRFNRVIFFILFALFAYLFGDCYFDLKYYQELQIEAKTAKDCQERIDSLIKFKDSDYYRHTLARITFLDKNEIESKISYLKQSKKEKEIKELENESNPDSRIVKTKKLLEENPTRENADQIKNIEKNSLKEIWNSEANKLKRELENKIDNEQITLKDEINSFDQRLLKLKNDEKSCDKQTLSDLESCFENLKKANSRKDWEKLAISIETEIQSYNNSQVFSQDAENRLREEIKTLYNKPRESFEKEDEYKNRLDKISADFKDLIVIKRKTAWEKEYVNPFKEKLANLGDNITEEIYSQLIKELINIKNKSESDFNKDAQIDELQNNLEIAYKKSKEKDWNKEFDRIKKRVSYVDTNNKEKINNDEYQNLLNSIGSLSILLTESDDSKKSQLDSLTSDLNRVYINGQTQDWRVAKLALESDLDNLSKINDIKQAKTKIDNLKVDLDKLRKDAESNSSWNLETEYEKIATKYNDIKKKIYSKYYDSEYTTRINQAEKYSFNKDIDEKINAFNELLNLKNYINENRNLITITDNEFYKTSKNIIDRITNYTENEIDRVIKIEEFSSARNDFLERVYKNTNLMTFLKSYNEEDKLSNEYEKLAKKIDFAEFNHDYSELFEITNQTYKEIFRQNNITKLEDFISKYGDKRVEFNQYISEAKKLLNYLKCDEITFEIKIESVLYPEVLNKTGRNLSVKKQFYNNVSLCDCKDDDWRQKKFDYKTYERDVNELDLYVECSGSTEWGIKPEYYLGGGYPKVIYKSDNHQHFNYKGECEFALNLSSEDSEIYKKYKDRKGGSFKAKIIDLKNKPKLSPITYKY